MDYMLNPSICAIWISQQAHLAIRQVPYAVWAVAAILPFTWLNILGIRVSVKIKVLAPGMGAIVLIFFASAARYVGGHRVRRVEDTRISR